MAAEALGHGSQWLRLTWQLLLQQFPKCWVSRDTEFGLSLGLYVVEGGTPGAPGEKTQPQTK